MYFLPHELRLLYVLTISIAVFVCAYRFVRRRGAGDAWQAALDAYVLTMAVQYASVGLPGLVGLLHWSSIMLISLAGCAALWWWTPPAAPLETSHGFVPMRRLDYAVLAICGGFFLGYVGQAVYQMRFPSVLANDAMTYHVPAAIHWLQTDRLGLYDVWFYNPANTYSPLAGSMFIAWLIAPMGNDVLAKFVQAPALLMLFIAMMQLCRAIGAGGALAAVVALAAVLARPLFSQALVAKDDLFLTVFFVAVMVGMRRELLQDRLGAWRVGIAMGLLVATKYTWLFSAPLLLMVIDAPVRAGWRPRHWLIAMVCVVLIAGPWYLRNLLLTGNPLYPTDITVAGVTLFEGMFTMLRSERLASVAALWENLTEGYYALPPLATKPVMAMVLAAAWVGTAALSFTRLLREPLLRMLVIGPVLSIALYALKSPYGEMRFIYPAILMLFGCVAWLLRPLRWWAPLAALPLAVLSTATAVANQLHFEMFTITGIVVSALLLVIAFGCLTLHRTSPAQLPRIGWASAALLALLLLGAVYVEWKAYIRQCSLLAINGWQGGYGDEAVAWAYIWQHLPPDATIAYANTYFTYPLYGFQHQRRVVYAPTRPGVKHLHHLPRLEQPTTGEDIPSRISVLMMSEADPRTWLENLRASGADYLLVSRKDVASPQRRVSPPELAFAANRPDLFTPIFANDFALLYEIRPAYND